MTDKERQAWWQDAAKGFFPWAVQGKPRRFFTWLWLAATAYVWNAGFQQFAATHQGSRVGWTTAGFALPVFVLLVLGSITLMFSSQTARKTLTALSLFLIHVFTSKPDHPGGVGTSGSEPARRQRPEHACRDRGGRHRRLARLSFRALPRHAPDSGHRPSPLAQRVTRTPERLPAPGGMPALDTACLPGSWPDVTREQRASRPLQTFRKAETRSLTRPNRCPVPGGDARLLPACSCVQLHAGTKGHGLPVPDCPPTPAAKCGMSALQAIGDDAALQRLSDLHEARPDWFLGDSIANAIELMAARRGAVVRRVGRGYRMVR